MAIGRQSDDALAAFVEWHVEAGADAILSDEPVDRFAASANPPKPDKQVPRLPAEPQLNLDPAMVPPIATGASDDEKAVADARTLAAGAETLDALKDALSTFEGCSLKATAKSLVFSDGNPNAQIMMIGEAPGRDEDIQGKPFVGRSGQLLDRMLAATGLDRDRVYIANIVPWRPPGNRTPTPAETEICFPFLVRQIELASPKIIVPLGGAAAKRLFETTDGILRTRGKWRDVLVGTHHARAMATLHPAYLLRSPVQKRLAWRDMQALKRQLAAAEP